MGTKPREYGYETCSGPVCGCCIDYPEARLERDEARDALAAAEERAAKAERERDEARETNASLHRRCQLAEAASRETVDGCRRAGGSLGRTLANWAAQHENEKRLRLAGRARRLLGKWREERASFNAMLDARNGWLDEAERDRDTARAEAARYRAALERIAAYCGAPGVPTCNDTARAALDGKP